MSEQGSSVPGVSAGGAAPPSVTGSGSAPRVDPPPGAGPPGAARPVAGTAHDWTVDVADRIESVVGTVRDKTTVPITKVVRGIVFGLVAGTLGIVALIFGLIGLFRLIEVYLPIQPYSARVWGTYAVAGAIFVLAGAFCWSKRKPRKG